jgi:hypothetical protein
MNARTAPQHFASPFGEPVTGTLLCSDWQHTDTLQLCLYGELPTEDDGYTVTGVTVPGSLVNIIDLFTGRQMEKMGEWLDFKDDTDSTLRRVAANAKYEAMRGPY